MNNDIRNGYPKYIGSQSANPRSSVNKSVPNSPAIEPEIRKPMADSMEILGTLGHAQVNMENLCADKNVRHSVDQYIKDPFFAQSWVNYCDNLIERGHNLEDALNKTDEFFSVLKDKNIYS